MLKHSFKYQGVIFSIDMPERIMYISGDSATGKGLFTFAQQYDSYCREHVFVVNFRNYLQVISNMQLIQDNAEMLYILDNYDLYADKLHDILKTYSKANFLIVTKNYSLIKDICKTIDFLKVFRTESEVRICRRSRK